MNAVLCNDLLEAAVRADEHSMLSLREICKYVFNYTPAPCWGSEKKIKDWLFMHKKYPTQAERIASGDRQAREDYI